MGLGVQGRLQGWLPQGQFSPPHKVRSQFPAVHSNFLDCQWLPAALLIVNKYKGSLAQNRKQRNLHSSISSNEPLQAEKL